MTEIGNSIRLKREELGYTLEEICEKTKISVVQLNAIENGDMDHFKHDMVFLRFYLKNICSVLELDYDEVLHQFNISKDQFTNTLSIKKVKENEESEANIAKRKQLSDSKFIYRNFKKKRFEVSFITLIFVIAVIVIGLSIVFFTTILPRLSVAPNVIGNNPIEEIPKEIVKDTTTPTTPGTTPTPTPVPTKIILAKTGLTTYKITDWVKDKQVKFIVKFNSSSMMKVYIDGVLTNNPSSRIYVYGETMEIIVNAALNREVAISFGYLKRSTITVDDQPTLIDPTIASLPKSFKMVFTFGGS
ncbi:MAG: helix-turn-helix domain-containing protein [Erysipelotrichaceae bacterium]